MWYIIILLFITSSAFAQTRDTIRVCTWSLLSFTETTTSERAVAMLNTIDAIRPDILVVQDIDGGDGTFSFYDNVASHIGIYAMVMPFSIPDLDFAIYFNREKFRYITGIQRATGLHGIVGWQFYTLATDDTLSIYSVHLKENDTQTDREQRGREALILRQHLDSLPRTSHYLVAGNLNVYESSEPAYETLTRVGIVAAGEVFDPINRPGDWHNDPEFADIHTQSTRVRLFGGGANGGMDDRFDQILLSAPLLPKYRPDSYTVFGNDGQHFNDSINAMPNLAVDSVMAQGLHDASDHLPVYLDLVFTKEASGVEEEKVWRKEIDLSQNKGW
jgi:hypothetical protein